MKPLFFIVCVVSSIAAFGQAPADTAAKAPVFTYVEQMPKANYDFNAYLSGNLHYPDKANRKNIQGRVVVQFVVNENGKISDVKVLRGIGGGCDEEAVRVIESMPAWQPGKQNGKAVKTLFTQPINFMLH